MLILRSQLERKKNNRYYNTTPTMGMISQKGCDYTNGSYIERMHKCSGAQWEKRLESKPRDYHRTKLNNSKAGVVNTGSAQGFEGFSHKINTTFENHSLLVRTTESRIQDTAELLDDVILRSKSESYCRLLVVADDGTMRLRQ